MLLLNDTTTVSDHNLVGDIQPGLATHGATRWSSQQEVADG